MVGWLSHAQIADESECSHGIEYTQRGVAGFKVEHRIGYGTS
jgi:hypothetical protein